MEVSLELETIDGWDAEVLHMGGKYYVSLHADGKGGPLMWDEDREVAINKFKDAMKVCDTIRKIRYVKKHGKFPDN